MILSFVTFEYYDVVFGIFIFKICVYGEEKFGKLHYCFFSLVHETVQPPVSGRKMQQYILSC